MRRRIIALFVLVVFLMTMVSPAMAQSDNPKYSQEQALKIARETLGIPDSLKNVQISYREEAYTISRKVWEFVWDDSKFNQWHSYRAEVNADTGEIISYSDDQDWNRYAKPAKPKSEQECRVIAQNLLTKLAPQKLSQLKEVELPDAKYQGIYPTGPKRYQFYYQRVVDGILFPENTLTIMINGDNGKVMNYWSNWDDSIRFPKAEATISKEEAEKIFNERIGLNLAYFQQYGYSPANTARKLPVKLYYALGDDYGYGATVDALTGKVIDMYGKEIPVHENVYLPMKPEPVPASSSGTTLTLEEAKAITGKYVTIPNGFIIQSSRYSEGWGAGSQKVWQFDYTPKEFRGGSSLSVGVDAVSGELVNYNRWEEAWDRTNEHKTRMSYDACKKLAVDFLQKVAPNKVDYVSLYEPTIKPIWYTDGKAVEPPVYNFNFRRVVNGVIFASNSINIDVDNSTGEIRGFWSNWDSTAKFADSSAVISEQEAFQKLIETEKPTLLYAYKIKENGSPSGEVMLVYRLYSTDPKVVDAASGKVISNFDLYNPIILEDISGHWAEQEIRTLASWGIITGNNNKFNPNKPVSRAEFVNMLAVAKGLEPVNPKTPTFKDVSPKAWYFGMVEAAAKAGLIKGSKGKFNPDSTVTRQEMVVMLINSLNENAQQDSSADLVKRFKDGNKVSAWAVKAMAQAVDMGLIAGNNGSLKPTAPATRAEAAVMLMKLISGENGGKPMIFYGRG